jgi:DNA replication protein DnaC
MGTWAVPIGHQACLNGLSTRHYRIFRLRLEQTQAKAGGLCQKALNQLSKVELLILDNWGLEMLALANLNDLMEVMDDRHGAYSIMIAAIHGSVTRQYR